jgi:hypothetical protein
MNGTEAYWAGLKDHKIATDLATTSLRRGRIKKEHLESEIRIQLVRLWQRHIDMGELPPANYGEK